jgi:hypothetical protein
MQIVAYGVGCRPVDHGLHTFHRHHFAHLARQRQGKVAQATEQVQHPLIGCGANHSSAWQPSLR